MCLVNLRLQQGRYLRVGKRKKLASAYSATAWYKEVEISHLTDER